jgi:hypothetical protein
MTTSLSENKRPWSVMPMRAFADRRLKERELRVLGALSAFTNRAGVCWPSMVTLCEVSGYAERRSVHDALKRLKQYKYVRQLQPKDFQETISGWKSNRYQVLWDGDEPLPTYEDMHIAKPLQLVRDQDDSAPEGTGGLGERQLTPHTADQPGEAGSLSTEIQLTAEAICHHYIRAVQQATGQVRLFDNEITQARRLAVEGFTPEAVHVETLTVCYKALARRAGVPALADVARSLADA